MWFHELSTMGNGVIRQLVTKKRLIWFIVFLALVVTAGQVVANKAAKDNVDRVIAKYDQYVHMEYDRVSTSVFSLDPEIMGITLKDPIYAKYAIEIHKVVLEDYTLDEDATILPKRLSLEIQGMRLTQEILEPDQRQKMDDLGYDQDILLDVHLEFDYDKKNKSFVLEQSKVHIRDCFEVRLAFHIDNLDVQELEKYFLVYLMFPEKLPVQMDRLQLTYIDESFFERMVKKKAKEQGLSVQEYVNQRKERIEDRLQAEESTHMRRLLKAVMDFTEKQNTFQIKAEPVTPVSVGRAINLLRHKKTEELLDLFNVHFST